MDALQQVLDFWFGTRGDDAEISAAKGAVWFGKSGATDRQIATQFGEQVRQAAAGAYDGLLQTPQQRLAVIILLDQFTRNIYRGRPECFVSDPQALQLALDGLERGEDRHLRPIERVFFYLPLEHAEQLALQERSVALFSRLLEEVPGGWRELFAGYHDYAVRHREVIARFGRFPHRNAILGRESTPEESEFLSRPGSSF